MASIFIVLLAQTSYSDEIIPLFFSFIILKQSLSGSVAFLLKR